MSAPANPGNLAPVLLDALREFHTRVTWRVLPGEKHGQFIQMASREPVADQAPYEELRKLGYLETAFDGRLVRPAAKAYVDYPHLTGVGQPVEGVHPIAVRRAAAKLAPILREYGVTVPYLPEEPDDWAWTEASVELIQALVEGGFVMPSVDDDVSDGQW